MLLLSNTTVKMIYWAVSLFFLSHFFSGMNFFVWHTVDCFNDVIVLK
jgi:hypothetical protein